MIAPTCLLVFHNNNTGESGIRLPMGIVVGIIVCLVVCFGVGGEGGNDKGWTMWAKMEIGD